MVGRLPPLSTVSLSLAERAKMMVRRKELYEEKHPETKNGRNQHTRVGNSFQPSSDNFAVSTAATIGKHERVVRLDVQRGTEIEPEALDLVARTPLDKARYLNTLMRSPREEQVERAARTSPHATRHHGLFRPDP